MKRFLLVTIEGRKYINDQLSLLSTGVYEFDCTDLNYKQLHVDGVLGSISTVPITISDSLYTNYFNAITKKLQIRLNASDLTNKKNFIITHVICLTNDVDLYWNIDPDSPNTRQVIFESRLLNSPSFGQSQENNLNGILSFSGSAVEVQNNDQALSIFFTENDSFNGCNVFAWRCEGTPATRKIVYKGTISKVDSDGVLKFTTEDFLKRLDNVYYSRGTYNNSIVSGRNQDTPESQKLLKIHRVFGRSSSFGYKFVSVTNEINVKFLDPDKMPQAYCVSYDPSLSSSVNRVWETAILEDLQTPMDDNETLTGVFVTGTGFGTSTMLIEIASGNYDNYSIGDTLNFGANRVARVIDVTANEIFISPNYLILNVGDTFSTSKVSALILRKEGQEINLEYAIDYTVGVPSAGLPIPVTLSTALETKYGFTNPIDPNTDQLFYKVRNTKGLASYSHGAQIKKILLTQFSASEINSASFDDADTALNLDMCFMLPFLNEDFPNTRDVIESLLTSSLGYLYLDDELKISYGNFKTPVPTENVTDTEISKGSLSHSIDFNDVYQTVRFNSTEFTDVYTMESEQASYLHKTNKVKEYPHICDIVSLGKPIAHFKNITKILTMKRILSQMILLNYEVRIGEEKALASSKKLGKSDCVVLSLNENDKENEVTMTQLENAKGNIRLLINGFNQGNI
jgi:hypothetical protein